ncbi:hypothetical protein SEA_LILBEANIE_56 [Gordonia phage Lilbeanie]|uniref:Uncharacterized protein n=1 Tax=Gordonia phage Lilbeanie TaxID=2794947 RepID=A0A7T1KSB0_9CAUD|nr:hypothetical protein J1773_gp56 [Gordonia phage Lilbeanie]QPO17134.1 hypothetical protein SEA_LILBEANIE_56 [Gordonia phage Lilbeanie]
MNLAAPDELTPDVLSARSNLAIEMMLNSAQIGVILAETEAGDRSPTVCSHMCLVYAYAVLLAGIDGPAALADPELSNALRDGFDNYPKAVRQAAAQASATALQTMGASL